MIAAIRHRWSPQAAALLAVALFAFASAQSVVMQARDALPWASWPICTAAPDGGQPHAPSGKGAYAVCAVCAAAAAFAVAIRGPEPAAPTSTVWRPWRPRTLPVLPGPPAPLPRARGPPPTLPAA